MNRVKLDQTRTVSTYLYAILQRDANSQSNEIGRNMKALEYIDLDNSTIRLRGSSETTQDVRFGRDFFEQYYIFDIRSGEVRGPTELTINREIVEARHGELYKWYFDNLLRQTQRGAVVSGADFDINPLVTRRLLFTLLGYLGLGTWIAGRQLASPDQYERESMAPIIRARYSGVVDRKVAELTKEKEEKEKRQKTLESEINQDDKKLREFTPSYASDNVLLVIDPWNNWEYNGFDIINTQNDRFGLYFRRESAPFKDFNPERDYLWSTYNWLVYEQAYGVTQAKPTKYEPKAGEIYWYVEVPAAFVENRARKEDDKPYKILIPNQFYDKLKPLVEKIVERFKLGDRLKLIPNELAFIETFRPKS